jgi:hypothetical protein
VTSCICRYVLRAIAIKYVQPCLVLVYDTAWGYRFGYWTYRQLCRDQFEYGPNILKPYLRSMVDHPSSKSASVSIINIWTILSLDIMEG